MKLAGLDIGTTGCKCTVFDHKGRRLGYAYQDYPARRSHGVQEIDLTAVMDGVYTVLRQIAAQFPDIAGIGVTSFGETFVMTDQAGEPLHTAMLYTDPRGAQQSRALEQALGGRRIARITGLHPHEMYALPKMMWIKENCPWVYEAARHIFLVGDYVTFRLTGRAQIDYSLASRTMGFDIRTLQWSREMLEAAGIDSGLLSRPVAAGTPAGTLTPEAAAKTGLSCRVSVITISHDQVAAAVGAGVFDSETAVDGAGTVQCLTPVFDALPDIDGLYDGYFSVVPYVAPGKYVAYAFSYTGGGLLQWYVDTLAGKEKELATQAGLSVYEYLERQYGREEPTGLLVLPHFAGAATPYMDTGAKGAILGLTTATTGAELYRACMEGVVYEMALNLQALQAAGVRFHRLRATGGGARSRVWMQMKADVLGMPVTALETADAGTVGSAMLTGVALGIFADLADAQEQMVRESAAYFPRAGQHAAYQTLLARYAPLYHAVRPLL